MFKYARTLVPAVLAAATLLLTACDLGGSADGTSQPKTTDPQTPSTVDSGTASTQDGTDGEVSEGSVDCGRHDLNNGRFGTHWLVVDPGIDGLVECDEALTVVEDYLAAGDVREESAEVANGWSCGATFESGRLEGPVVAIDCIKVPEDENRSGWAYQFTTKRV